MRYGRTVLGEKVKESLSAVLPVTAVVLVLCFTLTPIPSGVMLAFLFGAAMMVVGMGFFTIGTELAMVPMGEAVGAGMTRSRRLWLIILLSFFVGVMITVTEPDLQVLAGQVPGVSNAVLILAVGVGVGIFLVLSMLRILFRIPLRRLLVILYGLIFLICAFVPGDFMSVAFDSGGVTTGPMTVPFILALGAGVAAIRSDADAVGDSFGLVALCSVGPILAVLSIALFSGLSVGGYTAEPLVSPVNSLELAGELIGRIPEYLGDVALSLLPLAVFFAIFRIFVRPVSADDSVKTVVGVLYTYVGLVLFLAGVNAGFMPVGTLLGENMVNSGRSWLTVPAGMIIGWFTVYAEPAIHVLTRQVNEVTAGVIPPKALHISLSAGVSAAVGLAMVRALYGIPLIWIILPGYLLAILLSFFVPGIFTAIAFDSGGVASGPMTAAFLLPLAAGVCTASGGSDAFGVVALVAMTPLITIQLLGLYYRIKLRRTPEKEEPAPGEDIIEL